MLDIISLTICVPQLQLASAFSPVPAGLELLQCFCRRLTVDSHQVALI